MQLKSIFLGIAITAVLFAMLVLTRLMDYTVEEKEFDVREIDVVALPEPAPPVPEEEQIEEDTPPPPAPSLVDLALVTEVHQPVIAVSAVKVDPTLKVDTFFSDLPPSPLPTATVKRPVKAPKSAKPKVSSRPRIRQKPVVKSQYSIGELDQKPRLLYNPSVSFPRSIRGTKSGRVVVRVAILPSGKSRFLSVVSSSHSALIAPAKRIANGSRFTPPTRQGKPVKATMTWPITIKK